MENGSTILQYRAHNKTKMFTLDPVRFPTTTWSYYHTVAELLAPRCTIPLRPLVYGADESIKYTVLLLTSKQTKEGRKVETRQAGKESSGGFPERGIAVISPHTGGRRRGKEKGWEIIPYIRRGRLVECKNKRFYMQAHVWPGREPPAEHSSGVETKAAKQMEVG